MNLKQIRESKGVTQQQLADIAGLKSAVSISEYEKGEKTIPSDKLIKIAQYLDTTPNEILGYDIESITTTQKYTIDAKEYEIVKAAKSTGISPEAVAEMLKALGKHKTKD